MIGKNNFMLGAIAGVSALVLAIPLVAQISNAASSASSANSTTTQTSASLGTKATDTDKEVPDAQEAAVDPSQAKISADVAAQTATQAQPGTVHENKLENEQGNLAYKVEITNAGKEYDVLVDAVNGKVTKNWEDGQGGPGHGHDDANEANGTEVKDAPGQSDANETNDKADPNEQQDSGASQSSTASQQ